jgi:hypothetical protein
MQNLISKIGFRSKQAPSPVATSVLEEITDKVYDSIYVLTLDKFIDCICESKFEVLLRPGKKATTNQLEEAWLKIYEQYADNVQDSEQKYIARLSREINLLGTKLNLVNLIVGRLELEHNPDILAELKRILNVPGEFNPENMDQYRKDLQLTISLSKQLYMKMKEKEAELQRLMPTSQVGKIDRAHFDSLLIQLSKHFKFLVNRNQVFVSEFIAMMVDMRNTYDQHLKNAKNAKA